MSCNQLLFVIVDSMLFDVWWLTIEVWQRMTDNLWTSSVCVQTRTDGKQHVFVWVRVMTVWSTEWLTPPCVCVSEVMCVDHVVRSNTLRCTHQSNTSAVCMCVHMCVYTHHCIHKVVAGCVQCVAPHRQHTIRTQTQHWDVVCCNNREHITVHCLRHCASNCRVCWRLTSHTYNVTHTVNHQAHTVNPKYPYGVINSHLCQYLSINHPSRSNTH